MKIIVRVIEEEFPVKVRTKRKLKLTERYPQRIVIDERRKLHHNKKDYVDYDYYERTLKQFEGETMRRLAEKYAPVGAQKLKEARNGV